MPDIDLNELEFHFKELFIEEYLSLNSNKKSSDEFVKALIKSSVRRSIKIFLDKKPEVNSHIIRL